MATLLQLVTRLRRRLKAGEPSESGFEQDELNLVLVDLLNDAGEFVLGQNEWSFEIRHDGILRTMPSTEVTGLFLGNGGGFANADALYDALSHADTSPRAIRLVARDSPSGETALTLLFFYKSLTGTISLFSVLENIGKTIFGPFGATVLANEYVLPGTVRRVLSVTHQQTLVRLEEVDRSQVFDRAIQRPHETISDSPSVVTISGRRRSSVDRGSMSPSPAPADDASLAEYGQALLIYPTPLSKTIFNYSYVLAYARLVEPEDTWESVDPMVLSAIVDLAYAKAMQTDVGKDVEAGVVLETRAIHHMKQLLVMDTQMPGYRRDLRSNFSGRYGMGSPGRIPRYFGSL